VHRADLVRPLAVFRPERRRAVSDLLEESSPLSSAVSFMNVWGVPGGPPPGPTAATKVALLPETARQVIAVIV
jgi:hypothetical protein